MYIHIHVYTCIFINVCVYTYTCIIHIFYTCILRIYIFQVISGSDAIEVRSPPAIRVSLNLSVSIDDFFTSYLINNLAFVLGIKPSSIRVVNVVAEDSRRRRSLLAVNNSSSIVLELGEPAEVNISQPITVGVEEQVEEEENGEDSVDSEVCSQCIQSFMYSKFMF